jgi:hypothetical protein
VPFQNFAGPKGPLAGRPLFTGLKAGASTVVLPAQHLDADRVFSQAVKSCPFKTLPGLKALIGSAAIPRPKGRGFYRRAACAAQDTNFSNQ